MDKDNYLKGIYGLLLFFSVITAGIILKLTMDFFLPVVLAVLISCVFYPVVKRLHSDLKLPWVAGTLIMALLFIVIIMLLSTIIGKGFTSILKEYPKYEDKFFSIYHLAAQTFNLAFDEDQSFLENMWGLNQVRELVQSMAVSLSGGFISLTKKLGLVFVFSVFFLLEMQFGRNKITLMFQGNLQSRVFLITRKTVNDIVRYVSIKFSMSLLTGILVFVILAIAGVDFSIVWAFLAFVMNFIPTFGSIISVGLTSVFTIIQFYPSPFPIIFVILSLTIANLILGNVVEPKILGEDLGLSPFVILVSLSFWGWMWGAVGMIIAVPVMVTIKIICENISFLKPVAFLLGNTRK